jgi:L-asparaginase
MVCFKDSRNITDDDREKILATILASSHNLFLITHGTFTMGESAEYFYSRIAKLSGKTIVFAGSFIPLGSADSDAPFNLGFALAALMFLKEGIYVAMNGEIFSANTVEKNTEQLRFIHT